MQSTQSTSPSLSRNSLTSTPAVKGRSNPGRWTNALETVKFLGDVAAGVSAVFCVKFIASRAASTIPLYSIPAASVAVLGHTVYKAHQNTINNFLSFMSSTSDEFLDECPL